jgi:hypothetical protein
MAVTISTLPTEVVELILRCLINSELENLALMNSSDMSWPTFPPFTSIFCVCRAWYGIALPLLWVNVALGNDRLIKFTSAVTPKNATFIQSLTLYSNETQRFGPSRWHEDHEAHCQDLQNLASLLPLMTNLDTLSFLLTFNDNDSLIRYCPRKVIHSILD